MRKYRIQSSSLPLAILLTIFSYSQQASFGQEFFRQSASQTGRRSLGEISPYQAFSPNSGGGRFPGWLSISPRESGLFAHAASSTENPQSAVANGNRQQTRIDGTWREENDYVIINLNGQELRLAKSSTETTRLRNTPLAPASHPNSIVQASFATESQSSATPTGGTVEGRLLHRGRPLVECKMALIRLQRRGSSYTVDGDSEPQKATTDEQGNYRFENVPRGPYKLFWLPKNQRSWIRRIEYRPDVSVKAGELSQIKDIRVALRTAN